MLGGAAWVATAAALLAAGFLASVQLASSLALGRAEPGSVLSIRGAFAVYAQVVLVKGLLPALLLTLALWPLLDRGGRFSGRGRWGIALGLAIGATLGSVAAAAALLPLALPGLPSVKYTGTGNFVWTCLEMASAVMLAAWIPRSIQKRYVALIAAGICVVFVAGGASMTRWAKPAPQAAAPVPGEAAAPLRAPPAAVLPEGSSGHAFRLPDRPLPPQEPSREEIERRRALATRVRQLIEAGPDATSPPVLGGLLAAGEPHPVYENGELRGIELQNLQPDGFYARLGLREGDLVQSINGVALDAGDVWTEIARAPRFELEIERGDGTSDRITVPREQIIEGLRQLE